MLGRKKWFTASHLENWVGASATGRDMTDGGNYFEKKAEDNTYIAVIAE